MTNAFQRPPKVYRTDPNKGEHPEAVVFLAGHKWPGKILS
jgi:hypothetical protein